MTPTFEHVFALAIQNRGTWLQVLAAQELGDGKSLGIWRARRNGLWLSLLLRVRMLVRVLVRVGMVVAIMSSLLLLLLLLLGGGLLHRAHSRKLLLLDVLDKLGHRHAGLLGILGNLALDLLDLLGRGLLSHEARSWHGHPHRHCAWRRLLRRRRSHGDEMRW